MGLGNWVMPVEEHGYREAGVENHSRVIMDVGVGKWWGTWLGGCDWPNDQWLPEKKWLSGWLLSCLPLVAVDCGSPDPIQNGKVEEPEDTTFGAVAHYTCNEPYYYLQTEESGRFLWQEKKEKGWEHWRTNSTLFLGWREFERNEGDEMDSVHPLGLF